MKPSVQNHRKEESNEVCPDDHPFDSVIGSNRYRNRFGIPPWLVGTICIFTLLYYTSYIALLWLPPYEGADMRSQLTADYGAWAVLVFQPVDPAIIEEIRQERGLPEQILIDGSFWPTPISTDTTPPVAGQTPIPTDLATSGLPSSTPSASQPPSVSTPVPTSTVSLPELTSTPQPTVNDHPTESTPPKTPKTRKPRKTPKPKP